MITVLRAWVAVFRARESATRPWGTKASPTLSNARRDMTPVAADLLLLNIRPAYKQERGTDVHCKRACRETTHIRREDRSPREDA